MKSRLPQLLLSLLACSASAGAAPLLINGTPSVPSIKKSILEEAQKPSTEGILWQEASCYSLEDEKEVVDFAREKGVRIQIHQPAQRIASPLLASAHNPAFRVETKVEAWKSTGSFEALQQLKRSEIATDWYGRPAEPLQFALARDRESFWFLAARKGKGVPATCSQAGSRSFNLDSGDVVKFLIADYQGNRFWEINLAPNGAWSASFEDKLLPDRSINSLSGIVESKAAETKDGWLTMLRVPLNSLRSIRFGLARISVGGIMGQGPQRCYYSNAKDVSGEPDFKRPYSWPFTSLLDYDY